MDYSQKIIDYLIQQFNLPKEQVMLMLPEFKKTLTSHMAELESAYNARDLIDLQKTGHTIKGAFLNLGLTDCAELALIIEVESKNAESVEEFEHQIDQLRKVVNEIESE